MLVMRSGSAASARRRPTNRVARVLAGIGLDNRDFNAIIRRYRAVPAIG
jgi:hypothetical protein